MSGVAFPAKGSIGPATQTTWFGAIVDRLNMLVPFNSSASNSVVSSAPANYANLWTAFNSSFGATTTAPDGTTANSPLLVEDTSNSEHFIQAATFRDQINGITFPTFSALGVLRIAGFFKASTRTRVGFELKATAFENRAFTVVFDLAGGQIGVPFSSSGSGTHGILTNKGTQIIAYPNGWYLCIQDFYYNDDGTGYMVMQTFLDSGSGTGSISNSYTGNGTSGLYTWRTNMMPLAAWGINTQTFLEDFNGPNAVDINNTEAPGFSFYTNSTFKNVNDGGGVYPANKLSISNSILTISPPSNSGAIAITSYCQTNAATGAFVGQGFGAGKPTLFESRMSYDYPTGLASGGTVLVTWWGNGTEWIVSQGKSPSGGPPLSGTIDHSREIDIFESVGMGPNANPDTDFLIYTNVSGNLIGSPGSGISSVGSGVPHAGFPPWESAFTYATGGSAFNFVLSGGLIYQSKGVGGNTNQTPPNATYWTPKPYPSTVSQPAVLVDFTQMHLYSMLVIPFWSQPGVSNSLAQQSTVKNDGTQTNVSGSTPDLAVGLKMMFFDGALVTISAYWGVNLAPFQFAYPSNSDNQNLNIYYAPGNVNTLQIDYFKVTQ